MLYMKNLDSILKSRVITLLTKAHTVKIMASPVVMYGYASWTIKKAEHQRTDAFWIVVVEKTLDSKDIKAVNPRGNQLWIFIGRTDVEAEAPILWPPDAKNWITGKDPNVGRLRAGGEGGDRRWDGWVVSLTQWTWVWANNKTGQGSLERTAVHGVTESWTWLSDW